MSIPLGNINGSLVNIDNSHYPGSAFTSRVIPSTVNPAVLPEPLNKVQAANSYIPCESSQCGGKRKGKKINKTKIKNISNKYRMKGIGKGIGKGISKRVNSLKNKLMKMISKKRSKRTKTKRGTKTKTRRTMSKKTRRYRMRGGYSQYQNNMPMTQTYSLGGELSPQMSALASPPPYQVLSNCTNCVDNYSHYTNKGFPSRGWH